MRDWLSKKAAREQKMLRENWKAGQRLDAKKQRKKRGDWDEIDKIIEISEDEILEDHATGTRCWW